MRARHLVTTILGLLGAASFSILPSAWAAPPMANPPAAGAQAQPAASAPAIPVAQLPAPLEENDEMLQPVAPAAHIVATWDEALSALRTRSTDLRIALDEIERSDAQWRQSLAASLPTLTGSGNATWNVLRETVCPFGLCYSAPISPTVGASLTLTQPLLAPRAWHAAGTAKAAIEVARLSAEEQKRLLTIALANAVVSVVTAERISEINRVGLRAALDRLTLARRRVALGAGNVLDVVRADQDVSVARGAVVTGDESLRQARETLGLALGSAEGWGVPPDINLNGVEASARASCSDVGTLEERADIAAARSSVAVAKRGIEDSRLRYSPTIDLVSTLSVIGSTGEVPVTYPNGLHQAWTIAGVLTIPFYEGGARQGALRENRVLTDEATMRLEAARRNGAVQVTQARRGVEVADANRRVAERSRDLARETERLSRIAFQAGTGTSLDLIESGRRLREAEIQVALQEFGLVRARIAALLAVSRCQW
jgi:outer membrane protein TolC